MVKLVNTTTGESIDLRFVQGLQINLGPLPQEIEAELQELARFRKEWQQRIAQAFGVPSEFLTNDRTRQQP